MTKTKKKKGLPTYWHKLTSHTEDCFFASLKSRNFQGKQNLKYSTLLFHLQYVLCHMDLNSELPMPKPPSQLEEFALPEGKTEPSVSFDPPYSPIHKTIPYLIQQGELNDLVRDLRKD